ncbi:nucleoside hydrolase [Halosimplex halobium]|uniref:nucleoside hydrolase n=1 Tax=Halosimplex halobium TaxID=3396618 RepID=UPI003F5598BA
MTDPDSYLSDDGPTADDPAPVVLATDIGTDVDDTWALAQLLRTPQLDPRLVVTETGDPTYRASVAAKLLERAGRTDVPVGLAPDAREMDAGERTQAPWVDEYDLGDYPGEVRRDGVEALAAVVDEADEPVTVVSIGPTPTLATAVERHPGLTRECRFVGMHGSFHEGYDGGEPDAETNVRVDPAAFRTVCAAPWRDVLLTPLDTCGRVTLDGERYHRVWSATDDPLVRGVVENNCLFAARVPWTAYDDFARRSSTLFDCVAVYLAHDESLVETEPVRFDVTDDGFTEPDPEGEFSARVALEWADRDTFEAYLTERLLTTEPSPDSTHR